MDDDRRLCLRYDYSKSTILTSDRMRNHLKTKIETATDGNFIALAKPGYLIIYSVGTIALNSGK